MLLGGEGLLQLWSDSVGTQGKAEAPDHVKPAKPDDKPSATERLGGALGRQATETTGDPLQPGRPRATKGVGRAGRAQGTAASWEPPPWEGGSD